MKRLSQHIIGARGVWWAKQSIRAKQECWDRCRHYRAQRSQEIRDEYNELEEQFSLLVAEGKEDALKIPPLCMSAAALETVDLERFARLIASTDFASPARLSLVRSSLTTGPAPLRIAVPSDSKTWCRQEPEMPSWVPDFVKHRDFFGTCILVCQGLSGREDWKVVYAVQSPQAYLAVCKLEPVHVAPVSLPRGSSASALVQNRVDGSWKCNYGRMYTAADMSATSLGDLSVIFSIQHVGGSIITAQEEPVPVRLFMAGQPTRSEAKPRTMTVEEAHDQVYEDLVTAMPWLDHLDKSHGFKSGSSKDQKAHVSKAPSDLLPAIELSEDQLMDALADVEKARAVEATIAVERGFRDFRSQEQHGESNVKKGAAYHDALQGICCNADSDAWTRGRRMHVTFKATFTEHTEEASRVLVRAWVHRMQWFFDYEMSHGGPGFVFQQQ